MIGILGFAQAGKDTVANIIVKHGAQKLGFADELKRMVMQLFDFSPDQMWGTIEQKETPDYRYPREHTWDIPRPIKGHYHRKCLCCGKAVPLDEEGDMPTKGLGKCYLTPRYALKIVGTEGARHCWSDIWVKKAIEIAQRIEYGFRYDVRLGWVIQARLEEQGVDRYVASKGPPLAVFVDCRFINEVEGILKAGGRVYRIKRAGYDKPMFDHPSETEQLQIPDGKLSGVIENDGTLEDLEHKVCKVLGL
jgi:hypothetical protein